ncbi:10 kDa heat shock protein, mitochondrial [Melipona quadrifasciata]|uniref:10 kDa heat shock protein, mitochondrial n=1 Tax=Melipona quadrifasciata TaxID=166423 RepID=A0A0N0BB76_9HYME|nr:10 kDa heat shock protein, mitochondrial [Melipona quadrifasciata]
MDILGSLLEHEINKHVYGSFNNFHLYKSYRTAGTASPCLLEIEKQVTAKRLTKQKYMRAMAAANVIKRLVPLFDRVLIQRAEAVTKTKGGIVLPEKAQAKVLQGTVVAIGPGQRNDVRKKYLVFAKGEHIPLSIKVGDVVLLPEYGGTKVEFEDNKEFHLFRESDILAKLEV